MKKKLDVAREALSKAIPTVQWTTAHCKLSAEQHVRIGDCLALMDEALKDISVGEGE